MFNINFDYFFLYAIIILVILLYTLENNKYEFVINKSKFITITYQINNKNEVNNYLNNIKQEYPNATHYVYAYVLDEINYQTDDKEPSGSAGGPLLNVLLKNNLNHILIIVVRYFGGIKLGCSTLTRTYSKCASEIIKKSNIIELEKGYQIKLKTDLKGINKLPKIDMKIINRTFDNEVIYIIELNKKNFEILKNQNYNIEIIKEIEVKK